jgi:uncharacterized DUF497 family protein
LNFAGCPSSKRRNLNLQLPGSSWTAGKTYGETRYRAIGFLEERLHAPVFTETQGGIRVISFRKVNQREERLYEQAKGKP